MTAIRYTYSRHSTAEKAFLALEDMFAAGEVSEGERPEIETRRDHRKRVTHYEITLLGN